MKRSLLAAAVIARCAIAAITSSTVLMAAVWPATAQMTGCADQARTVSAAGLDLRTSAGQAMLMNRVRMAAQTVCLEDEEAHARRNNGFVSCYQDALTRAEDQAQSLVAAARARGMVAENAP